MKHGFLPLGLLLFVACTPRATYVDLSSPAVTRRSLPRDRYEADLLKSGSGRVEEWQRAGRRALRERLAIRPSFSEIVRFSPDNQNAIGYRFPMQRGQRLTVSMQRLDGRGTDLFAEAFEEVNPPSAMFRSVIAAHRDASGFEFEARSDGEYVLRFQPEIDASGTYKITVTTAAGLTFPVFQANLKSIGSFFGDSRDGGKRDHEGVDIFAPRGTPVVAVASGVITKVNTTPRGGKVVWQHDPERDVTYYYAHLTEQEVRAGERVSAGDRIGTVGNTGNAKTTPPHLHFSVYRPGQVALDPVPFLYDQPGDRPGPVLVDLDDLGEWVEITGAGVRLRSSPGTDGRIITELDRDTRVLAVGGVRDWQRVMLEDGRTGFVSMKLLSSSAHSR